MTSSRNSSREHLISAVLGMFIIGLTAQGTVADYLVVNRRVTLRHAPIAGADAVVQVDEGQVLPLKSDTKVNRFYQVEYPPDQISWVYQSFVNYTEGNPPEDSQQEPLGPLEVYILNVGQADAIFLRCPHGDHEMLIDAGDNRYPGSSASFKRQLELLQPADNPIEVVVATHPHADHIAGMRWVAQHFEIGLYVDSGKESSTQTFTNLKQELELRGITRSSIIDALPDIDFCPLEELGAQVIRPDGFGSHTDANDWSVVVRVDYGEDSFLFVGDAEDHAEEEMLSDQAARALLDCDLLKVGHHGSDTSSTHGFISVVTPDIAVVSCGLPGVGTNSRYKHPRLSTIDTLLRYVRDDRTTRSLPAFDAHAKEWIHRELRGALYCTALDGDLRFISRGDGIEFVVEP